MTGDDGQLELLPAVAPELRRESVALELLDGFRDATPSAKLRELITTWDCFNRSSSPVMAQAATG